MKSKVTKLNNLTVKIDVIYETPYTLEQINDAIKKAVDWLIVLQKAKALLEKGKK